MKIKLKVLDRIALLALIPNQGNYTLLKSTGEVRELLKFTDKEIKDLNMKQSNDGKTSWDFKKDNGKEFEISEIVIEPVKAKLIEMNNKNQLTKDHIGIYELIVQPENEESK